MSNKETLQSYNTKLTKNNTSLDSILETINKLPENKEVLLQDKEVTPSKEIQTITSDDGYNGLNEVTVNAIPDNYVEPTGSLGIVENGEYDVKNYDKAIVNVEGAIVLYKPRVLSFSGYSGNDLSYETQNVDVVNLKSLRGSYGMFENCSQITSLDLSHWDTSNITNMSNVFAGCSKLASLNVNGWDTSKVNTMGYMFYGCQKLTSLDLSNFDTSNVTNMSYMFYMNSNSLQHLDIRNFDFSKVTNSTGMFGSVGYFSGGCEIIVKDEAAKEWVLGVRSNLSNVKTVAEYEAGL